VFQSLKALRERSAALAAARAHLKATLTDVLQLAEHDFLQVNEIACPDPGCADSITVVLVMRAGEPTRVLRVEQALDQITAEDCGRIAAEERERRVHALP
jgi:hypothetical protein